ncbi:MAG: HNH endonuclease [Flavobacteriaceae bacterium]|nr:HNH endonuclease [Flavobacteriaceae bacterium]
MRRNWTREELIVAFNLYCQIEFGKIYRNNPKIIALAEILNRTPSAVSWKLCNFASFDPILQKRGIKGARNASKLDRLIFEEFTDNWETLVLESEILLSKFIQGKGNVQKEINFEIREGKEITREIKTRINQNFFRNAVLASYNSKCCLTGINISELLIASHIIPWSKNAEHRLNPKNGLCLNSLHDKAFDRGLISFDNDFRMIISSKLKENKSNYIEKYFLDLEKQQICLPNKFLPECEFLTYHRENIFIG